MRRGIRVIAAVMAAGCGGAPTTPTSATSAAPRPVWAALSCAPPADGRLHVVQVPGSTTPLTIWIEQLSPASGTSVRTGDRYEVLHRTSAPPGYTAMVQTIVADRGDAPGGFAAVTRGGCGYGVLGATIPRSDLPLQLYVRAWVTDGDVPAAELTRTFDRAPDYVAREPLPWTLIP